jgi:RNA polymerase sigma-70 factor, ECF subfamily
MNLSESYIQQMIGIQARLRAYVLTLVFDATATDDILQNVNLALCRKFDEFTGGTNFRAWAFAIARIECLAYWRAKSREQRLFSEASLEYVADQVEGALSRSDEVRQSLRECLSLMPLRQRELLESRYRPGGSIKEIAARVGRKEPAVSRLLYKLRQALLKCVRSRISRVETFS